MNYSVFKSVFKYIRYDGGRGMGALVYEISWRWGYGCFTAENYRLVDTFHHFLGQREDVLK